MLNACPNCRDASTGTPGALHVESFRLDKKTYVEVGCINCARLWTPRTINEIVNWNRERFGDKRADYIKQSLDRAVQKEAGEQLVK